MSLSICERRLDLDLLLGSRNVTRQKLVSRFSYVLRSATQKRIKLALAKKRTKYLRRFVFTYHGGEDVVRESSKLRIA
jgi:hypothetical protein